MRKWQLQEAKARFSEFLDASLKDGPQIVTRRGVDAAVLVPVAEWRRLKESGRPSLKELLFADEPKGATGVPPRRGLRRRPAMQFD